MSKYDCCGRCGEQIGVIGKWIFFGSLHKCRIKLMDKASYHGLLALDYWSKVDNECPHHVELENGYFIHLGKNQKDPDDKYEKDISDASRGIYGKFVDIIYDKLSRRHIKDIIFSHLIPSDAEKFAEWAWGGNFKEIDFTEQGVNLWNELHGDKLKLFPEGHPETDIPVMIDLWKKEQMIREL